MLRRRACGGVDVGGFRDLRPYSAPMRLCRAFALVFLVIVLAACSSPSEPPPSQPAPSAPTAPALQADRAQWISEQLASGDAERVADVVALPPGGTLEKKVAHRLSELANVRFDLSTFEFLDETQARINATTGSKRWIVYLVHLDGNWKISATQKVAS